MQPSKLVLFSLSTLMLSNGLAATQPLEEIHIIGHPLENNGTAQSITVLAGEKLHEQLAGSLGETLIGEVGVSSASFGNAVGRPVIHGLAGTRIKTTEDNIDTLDVSVTSGDHAVTIEPFIADKITVLKGANTLLYGSAAIGGVVDVKTGRIPTQLPAENLSGRAEIRAADNADATVVAVRLDGKQSENIAWHLDVFARDADDYDIPSEAESSQQIEAEMEMEQDHDDHATSKQALAGTNLSNSGGAFGLSYISDRGHIGIAISSLDADYGLINAGVGHHHEEDHAEEDHADETDTHDSDADETGMIELQQTRVDISASLDNPFRGIEKLSLKWGGNEYQHQELEPSGEVGTLFDNKAWEGRLQADHQAIAQFEGSFGLQINKRDFDAAGEEAFLPKVSSDSQALFWVGEREFSNFSLETGLRVEHLQHQTSSAKQDFDTISTSVGLIIPVNEHWQVAGLLDYSQRAPSIEELFSNGPHFATQSFEIGSEKLKIETASSLSFTAERDSDDFNFVTTLYAMSFDDFIYQQRTGDIEDDLPVSQYLQSDANFYGLDAKLEYHVASFSKGDLDISLMFDTVRAKLSGKMKGDNLARIPASRFGLGIIWRNASWDAKINLRQVFKQNDLAPFELATSAYNDISIYVAKHLNLAGSDFKIFINGRNLSNQEQRNHSSFVKDFAPAAGRRFELGVRWNF